MTNARVRKAFRELRRFYARNSENPYIALKPENAPPRRASATAVGRNQPDSALDRFTPFVREDEGNIISEFMGRLTTKSETAAGMPSIFGESSNLAKSPPPVLVTPYVGDDLDDSTIVSSPLANTSAKGKKTRQGTMVPANGKYYTFADAAGLKAEEARNIKVSLVQVFSPVDSLSTSDTDIASVYMNSITSLEASRAVPYMDVTVVASVGEDNEARPMSLGRFLGINDRTGLTQGTADYALAWGQPVIAKSSLNLTPDNGEQIAILSGIEAFTTPQTLVNADEAYAKWIPTGKVTDPFQPFLSLESMKLSIIGAGGLMSQRSGELSIILHDRARMDEIATLLAPGKYGKARIIVTYGYAHPDGTRYSATALPDQLQNPFGELIDNMRTTEVFTVASMSFSFDANVVKMRLQIVTAGASELNSMDIVLAGTGEDELKNVRETLAVLNRRISEINSTRTKQITTPSFVSNISSISGNGLTKEQTKALKEFRKNLSDEGSIINMLNQLYGVTGLEGDVGNAVATKNARLDRVFEEMTSTPDPFLPSIAVGDLNTADYVWDGRSKPPKQTDRYVSLGKVISTFLGSSLGKSSNINFALGDEVQIFFHPFNRDAGGLQDYNIAQFVIDIVDLKKVLKERFDLTGRMSLGRFMELLRQFFVGDLGSLGYGLLTVGQRNLYKLDPKTGKRSAPNQVKVKKKSASTAAPAPAPAQYENRAFKGLDYQEALEKGKKERLRGIYVASEHEEVVFRPPDLHFSMESVPRAASFVDDPNGTSGMVFKIHVIDRTCSTMATLADFIRAAGTSGIMPIVTRIPDPQYFPYTSAHSVYGAKTMKSLLEQGLLKRIDRAELESTIKLRKDLKIDGSTLDSILRSYLQFNREVNAKEYIMKAHPTLVYGSAATGMLSATFSAEADSQLASIMLVRAGKNLNKSDDKDGVPVSITPASVSLETLGCPYFSFAQFFYLDFGTNTDVDNVYGVTSIDHNITPGKFTTSLKMTLYDAFGSYRPLTDEMTKTFLGAFLAKFSAKATPAAASGGGRRDTTQKK